MIDLASHSPSSTQPSIHSSESSAPISQNISTLRNIQGSIPSAYDPTKSMVKFGFSTSDDSSTSSKTPMSNKEKIEQSSSFKRKLRDLSDIPTEIKIVRTYKKQRAINSNSTSTDCTATLRQVKKGSKDQLRKGSWRPP